MFLSIEHFFRTVILIILLLQNNKINTCLLQIVMGTEHKLLYGCLICFEHIDIWYS